MRNYIISIAILAACGFSLAPSYGHYKPTSGYSYGSSPHYQRYQQAPRYGSRKAYRSARYGSRKTSRSNYKRVVDESSRYKTGRTFVFSPRSLTWKAYDNGRLVRSGRASGGKGYCPDVRRRCRTPVGHFRVNAKRGAGCKSSKYPLPNGGAKMPYCMFFYRGYAIHGSNNVPNHNASHGCIRVHPPAAKWLNHNFLRMGTRVIVKPY